MVTEIIILALLFLAAGIFLLCGKGAWLVAGYNTLSQAEKKKMIKRKYAGQPALYV